jgi:hypothetical protein
MCKHFSVVPIPSDSSELKQQIEHAFLLLTGHPLSSSNYFFVEKYAHGGMSSGVISPAFWREKAVPLLVNRYAETTS